MRSELPWVEVPLPAYAASVVAKTFPVGNNPFRGTGQLVGTTLTQGSSLRIANSGLPAITPSAYQLTERICNWIPPSAPLVSPASATWPPILKGIIYNWPEGGGMAPF